MMNSPSEERKLSELLETLESGGRPKGGVGGIRTGIPSIGGEHITRHGGFDFTDIRFVPEVYYKTMNRGKIEHHDILLVKDGATTGKVAYVDDNFPYERAVVNEHVFIVRTSEHKVIPKFLFYYLYSPIGHDQVLSNFHGAAQGGINSGFADNVVVPTPPLAVQEKITAILDRAYQLSKHRDQANQLTNKIIQSVFLKMFGDPVGNPKKWTTEKLGRLAVRITKGESPKWQGFEYVRDGVLFIRSENVLWGYLDLEEETRIPKEFHDKLERSQLRPRDVLINLVGASIGRAAMVPETITEANINQAVGVITLGPELKPKFLVQFLISPSVQQIIQGGKVEAARANISLGDLRELDVVVPPIDLQDKFVEFTKKLEALRERQAQSEDETGALFHSLMHKAFRGELVT